MSENPPDDDKPGIEFDYRLGEKGMQTAVVIRDPNKIRKLVMAQFQWIPSVMPGSGAEYPGMDALDEAEARGETIPLPILVLGHMPSHLPPEEAVEDIQHILFLVEPEQLTQVIASGVNMFADDDDVTHQVMHMFAHLLGQCDGHGDDDDDDQG
jgi:hypothetical protein